MKPTFNYALYGDPGYSNSKYIKVGYKNHQRLSEKQKFFNKTMSALRVSVEYGFGKILQLFAFVDFKKSETLFATLENAILCRCVVNQLLYLYEWKSNL